MIPVSSKAQRTHNPIRAIVDNLKRPENHEKKGNFVFLLLFLMILWKF